jgi:hypothetical protein
VRLVHRLAKIHASFDDQNLVSRAGLVPVMALAPVQAEEQHRDHAILEQVLAYWADGPLAHLPPGSFPANAAWLALAAISHNLLRAAGSVASLAYAINRNSSMDPG